MKIGFIGLGTMGVGMALNILKAGHDVTVHNRTRQKEEEVAKAGAGRAESPGEAAEGAEIIVTMVTIISAPSAASRGDSARLAPSLATASSFCRVRL